MPTSFQSVFIYWALFSVKWEFIHMASLRSSFISDASWSTLEQWLCAHISYPRIEVSSVWKAHERNQQVADQFWLPHHWHSIDTSSICQILTSYLMPVCREGGEGGEIFLSEKLQQLPLILKQFFPQKYCSGSCSLFCLLWWGLLYFSKPADPTFAVFPPYCLIGAIILISK